MLIYLREFIDRGNAPVLQNLFDCQFTVQNVACAEGFLMSLNALKKRLVEHRHHNGLTAITHSPFSILFEIRRVDLYENMDMIFLS